MDRALVQRKRCEACTFHSRLVGCPELGHSVPEDYCTRHCQHQCGDRGAPDGTEGKQKDDGPDRLPPLSGPAMCGAPKTIKACGGVRPIFQAVGGLAAMQDPASNITPACNYPKELRFSRALIELEV